MLKCIFIGLILFPFIWNSDAQNRKALATEITNQMSFMKKEHENRQIEFRDSLYATPFFKIITKNNISKDSLSHLLVDNGFFDFNIELFELRINKLNELNEAFIKIENPQLAKLLSDSTNDKVTYSFQESADGIGISLILSKNDIIVDDEKEGYDAFMPGAEIHRRTFKAFSKKKGITYCEDKSYSNLIKKEKQQQNDIKLDDDNRFKVTIHFPSSIDRRYIGIKDSAGNMLSIIKL